jgi:hypothetical protein
MGHAQNNDYSQRDYDAILREIDFVMAISPFF